MLPAQYSLDPLILLHRGFEGANSYNGKIYENIKISFHDHKIERSKRRDIMIILIAKKSRYLFPSHCLEFGMIVQLNHSPNYNISSTTYLSEQPKQTNENK